MTNLPFKWTKMFRCGLCSFYNHSFMWE